MVHNTHSQIFIDYQFIGCWVARKVACSVLNHFDLIYVSCAVVTSVQNYKPSAALIG